MGVLSLNFVVLSLVLDPCMHPQRSCKIPPMKGVSQGPTTRGVLQTLTHNVLMHVQRGTARTGVLSVDKILESWCTVSEPWLSLCQSRAEGCL